MNVFCAAVREGRVVDVEQLDESLVGSERSDGLWRVECPEWVQPGMTYSGERWLLEDGSSPGPDITRRWATPAQILDKLPQPEVIAVCAAALQNPAMHWVLLRLAASVEIANDDPQFLGAMGFLVDAGVLTQRQVKLLSSGWSTERPYGLIA